MLKPDNVENLPTIVKQVSMKARTLNFVQFYFSFLVLISKGNSTVVELESSPFLQEHININK